MKRVLLLLAVNCFMASLVQAETHADAAGWLQKMALAAQKLNYTGTFIYQSSGSSETSRITHVVDATGEREKLEVLDGSPREIVRTNDEVKCFLPEDKVVIVEKRRRYKAFPALLPYSLGSLGEHYHIRKGEVARIAGLDSQLIILEPRDNLRYGHMLWADTSSGLLLKARMVDEKNEPIEQFAFTQLQIGGVIDRESLKTKFSTRSNEWRVQNARAAETGLATGDWVFKTLPAGFRKSAGMKRHAAQPGIETTHYVFSDGLASISVFIESLGAQQEKTEPSTYSAGAINVYKRVTGGHQLTVLGEVPAATLKRLGDGMELKRK
jgi:sigma-E factor negative regulatory protein RseB